MSEGSDELDAMGSDEAAPDAGADTGASADADPAEESLDPAEDAAEAFDDGPSEPAAATGHPAVDEVLRSLDALEGRPVDEHVAAFEDAHEQLRRALSSAGDDTP
jgi:hypothetical protein